MKVEGWQSPLECYLLQRQQQQLWRQPQVTSNGWLDFSSNDYLGLSCHPEVLAAFQNGLTEYGCGSGGSPLIAGYQRPHQRLVAALADWLGYDAVLLTSSGYAANHAVVAGMQPLQPRYFFDKRNHASMYDAVRAVHADHPQRLRRFRHNDSNQLAQVRACTPNDTANSASVIATEGVFSMDGDAAPLDELGATKQHHANTLLWIDDAHGLGVTGRQGAGVRGLAGGNEIDVVSGSFAKAFGVAGGFVASHRSVIESAWQQSRHYIYSSSFSAAQACALIAALSVVRRQDSERAQLAANIAYFQQGLVERGWRDAAANQRYCHAIQPLVVGEVDRALRLARHLNAHHIACVAIRPPTVPFTQAGVRVSLRANHSVRDIQCLLDALGDASGWGVSC